jgi:hypothetical protein
MVCVVIHDRHTAVLAQPLEAATHTGELRQRRGRGLERAAKRIDRGERGHGVPQIVNAGYPQSEAQGPAIAPDDPSFGGFGPLHHFGDAQVRRIGKAEPAHPPAEPCTDPRGAGIVGAEDGDVRPACELGKGVFERRLRPVALKVVGLDVVHHRYRWMKG